MQMQCSNWAMAEAKKKRVRKPRENYSAQIVVRVKPSTRERLDALAERKHFRGIGEAVRHVLETGTWQ